MWEYKTIEMITLEPMAIEKVLNDLGKANWELISYAFADQGAIGGDEAAEDLFVGQGAFLVAVAQRQREQHKRQAHVAQPDEKDLGHEARPPANRGPHHGEHDAEHGRGHHQAHDGQRQRGKVPRGNAHRRDGDAVQQARQPFD